MNLSLFSIGETVKATFIPYPYLGTGVTEVKTVDGKFGGTRVSRGRTYVIIEDASGKVIMEKDAMDLQSLVSTASAGEAKSNPPQTPNYNRH